MNMKQEVYKEREKVLNTAKNTMARYSRERLIESLCGSRKYPYPPSPLHGV